LLKLVTCVFLFSALAQSAFASVEIKGFGTAGLIKSDAASYYLQEFDTYGSRVRMDADSLIGLNLSSNLSAGWTVATQLIVNHGVNGYTPRLDWGFVSYQPMPEIALRAGRFSLATWLFSQQIHVGYSYLWVRPPVEVYTLIGGFSNFDGMSALSNLSLFGGTLSAELYGGAEDNKSYVNNPANPTTTDIRMEDLAGVDLSYSYKDLWTLHASYLQSHPGVKIYSSALISNPVYGTVIVPMDLHFGRFFSMGGKLDYSNVLFITEFARRLIDGQALQSASAWYATLGYRISKFTPYLSYAWQGSLRGTFYTHPLSPAVTTMKINQYSYTAGLNYQAHDSVVLKAEWQPAYYKYLDSSYDFRVNMVSASANFIF